MDRIAQLELLTKDYFMESNEFFFSKKYVNQKKKKINLVFNAYNLEYNLVLKDFKIFFENKLKNKFVINTRLSRDYQRKKFTMNKYGRIAKNLKGYKFYDKNFDLKDIGLKNRIVFNFKVSKKRKSLTMLKQKSKNLTKKFFYNQLIAN